MKLKPFGLDRQRTRTQSAVVYSIKTDSGRRILQRISKIFPAVIENVAHYLRTGGENVAKKSQVEFAHHSPWCRVARLNLFTCALT